jgi:hypothetical protein
MPDFELRFLKTITNDVGLTREITQRVVEVAAEDAAQAVLRAQAQFCALEHVPDWGYHADRFELVVKSGAISS